MLEGAIGSGFGDQGEPIDGELPRAKGTTQGLRRGESSALRKRGSVRTAIDRPNQAANRPQTVGAEAAPKTSTRK
eukprot:8333304-Alexandrium_andersonii.AAC.1